MSDFFIDFRKQELRNTSKVSDSMRYFGDIRLATYHYEKFSLVLSRPDDWSIWGPYKLPDSKVFISISGRIALDDKQWEAAANIKGDGGLACKFIYKIYESEGILGLEKLNGNYVVLVFDDTTHKLFIIIDRCGAFPCFGAGVDKDYVAISSHPDILANASLTTEKWDITSMAEFLITGKISYPYTFYEQVKCLDFGSVHTIDLSGSKANYESSKKYFYFNYAVDHKASEWDLAEELATAFKKSVQRRTSSLFGKTAISLSGGLDSRTMLCSSNNKDHLICFSFYDNENMEYRISQSIAREAGVELIPFKRDFDHYGNSAELGVKISGGMGSIFNNHFLGFREKINELGIRNLLTGFYCDYLFKGLALDFITEKTTRREVLTKFNYQWYRPYFWFRNSYTDQVMGRLDEVFPEAIRNDNSKLGKLKVEEKRLFPLCYEPDNAETTIPQRVLGWYLPIVDNNILDVYLKIPPEYKLNVSMYSKMVQLQCGKRISRIPNSNTGAPVNASQASLLFHKYLTALRNRFEKNIIPRLSTSGSWPNWEYYIHNSRVIELLWSKKNDIAKDIFCEIIGEDQYRLPIQAYSGSKVDLFSRMLTLKIWIELHYATTP